MHDIHPSNPVLLDGAVFDGRCEGLMRRRSAAGWLALYDHCPRAGAAIRRARDGAEGAAFCSLGGVVWHPRRVEPAAD